jgi:hypothetical protein
MRNFKDPLYIKWRLSVYKRDNHTCQWPNCTQHKKLNAHHIKNWANYPGLRFMVENGITLCKQHHQQIKGQEEIYAGVFFKIIVDNNEKRK